MTQERTEIRVGIDEAGRGPLVGPVVAAAVSFRLPETVLADEPEWKLVRDSKKLSEKQRERAAQFLRKHAIIGVGIVHADTIDRVNILEATFLAMKAAFAEWRRMMGGAGSGVPWVLVDGNQIIPNFSERQEALVGGDATEKTIAAASIIAKVTRDHMMLEYDKQYPGYGFAKHKGYGTQEHMSALRKYGPTPIHRLSFRPVFLSLPENANKRFSSILSPKRRR